MAYTIAGVPERVGGRWMVLCRCTCGTERLARCKASGALEWSGGCQSCARLVHGHSSSPAHAASPTHSSWSAMLTRCTNDKAKDYARYGGAGIAVCDRWRGEGGFENFLADMGERPEGTTLDRYPQKTGNYEPTNCRWASSIAQANNRVNNVLLQVDGETITVTEASAKYGVPRSAIDQRLRDGWPDDAAAKTRVAVHPKATEFMFELNGETLNVAEASRRYGVRRNVLHWRLFKSTPPWPAAQAVGLEARGESAPRHGPTPRVTFVLGGEEVPLAEAAQRYGVPLGVLRWRLFLAQPPWPAAQAVGLEPHVRTRRRAWEKPDST